MCEFVSVCVCEYECMCVYSVTHVSTPFRPRGVCVCLCVVVVMVFEGGIKVRQSALDRGPNLRVTVTLTFASKVAAAVVGRD